MGVMLNMVLIAIALFARFQNKSIIDLVCSNTDNLFQQFVSIYS